MPIFVDTSALYASISETDENHPRARTGFVRLADHREVLVTSNYVVVETVALIGRRLGPVALRVFQADFAPLLRITWVDAALHNRAMTALLITGERDLSLVDCVSFELMRQQGLTTAFAFDSHFARQGFSILI
jgi:uncharacterized protein